MGMGRAAVSFVFLARHFLRIRCSFFCIHPLLFSVDVIFEGTLVQQSISFPCSQPPPAVTPTETLPGSPVGQAPREGTCPCQRHQLRCPINTLNPTITDELPDLFSRKASTFISQTPQPNKQQRLPCTKASSVSTAPSMSRIPTSIRPRMVSGTKRSMPLASRPTMPT